MACGAAPRMGSLLLLLLVLVLLLLLLLLVLLLVLRRLACRQIPDGGAVFAHNHELESGRAVVWLPLHLAAMLRLLLPLLLRHGGRVPAANWDLGQGRRPSRCHRHPAVQPPRDLLSVACSNRRVEGGAGRAGWRVTITLLT